jgi:hypothetical protein
MKPATVTLTIALKAAVLPMFMRARRKAMSAETRTEYMGRRVEGWTYVQNENQFSTYQEVSQKVEAELTRLIYPLKGTPLSLANDQRRREAVAIVPLDPAATRKRIKLVIIVAPVLLLVAWAKISMKGTPVGVFRAALVSPRQNKSAISIASPKIPLTIMVATIAQGTTVVAL